MERVSTRAMRSVSFDDDVEYDDVHRSDEDNDVYDMSDDDDDVVDFSERGKGFSVRDDDDNDDDYTETREEEDEMVGESSLLIRSADAPLMMVSPGIGRRHELHEQSIHQHQQRKQRQMQQHQEAATAAEKEDVANEAEEEDEVERARREVFEEALGSLRRSRSSALERARRGMQDMEEYYESELDAIRAELDAKESERLSALAELNEAREETRAATAAAADAAARISDTTAAVEVCPERIVLPENVEAETTPAAALEEKEECDMESREMDAVANEGKRMTTIVAASDAVHAASAKHEALQDMVSHLRDELATRDEALEMQRESGAMAMDELRAEARAAEAKHMGEDAEKEAELRRLRRQVATLEHERAESNKTGMAMEMKIGELEDDIHDTRKKLKAAETAAMLSGQEVDTLRRQVDMLGQELHRAEKAGAEKARLLLLSDESLAEIKAKYKNLQISVLNFRGTTGSSGDENHQQSASMLDYNAYRQQHHPPPRTMQEQYDHRPHPDTVPHGPSVQQMLSSTTSTTAHQVAGPTYGRGTGSSAAAAAAAKRQNSSQARQLLEENISGPIESRMRTHAAAVTAPSHYPETHISPLQKRVDNLHLLERASEEMHGRPFIHEDKMASPPRRDGHVKDSISRDHAAKLRFDSPNDRSFHRSGGGTVGSGIASTSEEEDVSHTAAVEAVHNKENNESNAVPFATDASLRDAMQVTSQIEHALMLLNQEKDALERELSRLPSAAGRTIAARRRKAEAEARLDEVRKHIAKHRMKMREMHVL